jgi:Protein of unknown function (DUF1638)
LHNRPERIADAVEALVDELSPHYERVAVGYADCGTYGALDELCSRRGLTRLAGLHCYDLFGGADRLERLLRKQPGTYLLTDFLVRSFERTVVAELGLDRYPELRDDYFGQYTRVVWLAQHDGEQPEEELTALAHRAADRIGLPLTIVPTGTGGLERALLEALWSPAREAADVRPA